MTAAKQWMKVRTTGSDAPIHSRNITCEANGCRPVVVIDPEDREQVERLAQEYKDEYWVTPDQVTPEHVDALQAALREFANPTPPRPEEPQGLGAVVEAEYRDESTKVTHSRRVWARAGDGSWVCLTDGASRTSTPWPFLSNVRVLSEGVQAGDPR